MFVICLLLYMLFFVWFGFLIGICFVVIAVIFVLDGNLYVESKYL